MLGPSSRFETLNTMDSFLNFGTGVRACVRVCVGVHVCHWQVPPWAIMTDVSVSLDPYQGGDVFVLRVNVCVCVCVCECVQLINVCVCICLSVYLCDIACVRVCVYR